MPHCLEAEMMGAIKAKLDPRKMGTLPLVTKWKMNVPKPAVNRAVAGSRPTSRGTRTVEPKATNRNWMPTMVFLAEVRLAVSIQRLLDFFFAATKVVQVARSTKQNT
jgi:hypothetical protein